MRKVAFVLCVAMCASQALAWGFTEDFNSYPNGTNTWGSGGKWTEPTANLRIDAYTADNSKGPRCGNTSARYATAPLPSYSGAFNFSSDSFWSNDGCSVDAVFIVLSDSAATAQLVPKTATALGSPINAIAWGHVPGSANQNDYGFFNGQTWSVIGQNPATFNTKGRIKVTGSLDGAGNWSAAMSDFTTAAALGSNNGALAANFSIGALTIISQGNASQVYSGVDNINITPEPAMACLLGLGFLFLRRRTA